MKNKLLLGTIAYTLITFPIAIVWHILLFKEQYSTFGYLPNEPSFAFGFISILLQGFLLTLGFQFIKLDGTLIKRTFKYVSWIGLFFWTSHVLAFMAKTPESRKFLFFFMESFYLFMQFSLFGLALSYLYRKNQ